MMRSGKGLAGVGVFGVLLPVLVMVVFAAGAVAQAVNVQYNGQNCAPIVQQVNEITSGGASATEAEAAATVSNDLDISQDIVINCINGSSGGENANANKTDRVNIQNCAPIVAQYNNIVSGGATANGEAAIAEVANNASISQNIVINCINGDDKDVVGGDKGDDATEKNTGQTAVANSANCTRDPSNTVETTSDTLTIDTPGTYFIDTDSDEEFSFDVQSSGDAAVAAQQGGDGDSVVLSAATYTLSVEGEDNFDFDANDFSLTVFQCIDTSTVNNDKTLPNTGGTVGVVESSPVSSVVVPAGALLAMSSVAGIFWLMRRAESNGER